MGEMFRVPCENCYEIGKICDVCDGAESVYCCDDDDCEKCGGTGEVECTSCKPCPKCDGEGYSDVYVDHCPECGGKGDIECDCTGGLGCDHADDDCPACNNGLHICPCCRGTGFDPEDLAEHSIDIDYD